MRVNIFLTILIAVYFLLPGEGSGSLKLFVSIPVISTLTSYTYSDVSRQIAIYVSEFPSVRPSVNIGTSMRAF